MTYLKTFLSAAFSLPYFQQAIKVSLVVGTLLFLINDGEVLFTEGMTGKRWITALFTYLIPYLVSVHGRFSAHRSQKGDWLDL